MKNRSIRICTFLVQLIGVQPATIYRLPPESPKMTHRILAARLSALALLGSLSAPALAHEGHGLPGLAHWHATDVLGFVALAAIVAGVIWFKGRK